MPDPVIPQDPAVPTPAPNPAPDQHYSPEYVKELREENKGWRLKAAEQERLRKEGETASKAAQDAIAAREAEAAKTLADLASKADARVINAELRVAAREAGMIDLDGIKLADISGIKLDKDGNVTGATELMTALKAAKPYLFTGKPVATTGMQAPSPAPADPRKALAMSEADYRAERRRIAEGGAI